nr:immunoglobulin light chain junction region [Macaca mulatta]
CSSYVDSNVLC